MKSLFNAILIILVMASQVGASVDTYVPIKDLANKADLIIVGTVVQSTQRRSKVLPDKLYTDYKIQVKEDLLRSSPIQIVLSESKEVDVEELVFDVGETYILFLSYTDHIYVLDNFQGVFPVVYDEVKDTDYVVSYDWRLLELTAKQEVVEGSLVELDSNGGLIVTESSTNKRGVPLAKSMFVEFIKKYLSVKMKSKLIRNKIMPPGQLIPVQSQPIPIQQQPHTIKAVLGPITIKPILGKKQPAPAPQLRVIGTIPAPKQSPIIEAE